MRLLRLRQLLAPSLLVAAGCGSVKNTEPDATVEENREAPVNTSSAGVVNEGAQMSLTGKLVTTDADTANQALVYTVMSLPADGALQLNGVDLDVGQTFTQKDVIDSNVIYKHGGAPDTGDSFEWTLTDGMHSLPPTTFQITVTPVNDAPMIVNNLSSDVAEGATFVLTPDVLSLEDEEDDVITFEFVSAARGSMQRRVGAGPFNALVAGDTFTVADITDGNIRYVDPGTDDAMLALQQSTQASFSWRVRDDAGAVAPSETGAFVTNFTITPVDDPPVFTWRANVCALPGPNVATNPLVSLTDVDNTAADYTVCLVSVGTGSVVLDSVSTQTQIPLVVQNGTTNLAIGACVPANALTGINVDSTAGVGVTYLSGNRGQVQWRLMKGAVQVGAVGSMSLPIKAASPCP